MDNRDFKKWLADADKYSLEYIIDEWRLWDNKKYLEKFSEEQIEEMEDKLAKES